MDEQIKLIADRNRFLCEVKMNSLVATFTHYHPYIDFSDFEMSDLVEIVNRYRSWGVIQ